MVDDPDFQQLCQDCTPAEIQEIQQYLTAWSPATYATIAQSILDHAERKGFTPLKYLRKAHNFNRKGAKRIPKFGYRPDGFAVYRKGTEFLIVRQDKTGAEKIVTYSINEE